LKYSIHISWIEFQKSFIDVSFAQIFHSETKKIVDLKIKAWDLFIFNSKFLPPVTFNSPQTPKFGAMPLEPIDKLAFLSTAYNQATVHTEWDPRQNQSRKEKENPKPGNETRHTLPLYF
jgi:hypothetical protein